MRRDDAPSVSSCSATFLGASSRPISPDPRGWTVSTVDGWEIGHLKDLVIDATTLEVRYLLVELWSDLLDEGAHSEVLTSAERARLSLGDHTVTVPADGPDELWLYIGRHYKLGPGGAEARPAPWVDAHDLGHGNRGPGGRADADRDVARRTPGRSALAPTSTQSRPARRSGGRRSPGRSVADLGVRPLGDVRLDALPAVLDFDLVAPGAHR